MKQEVKEILAGSLLFVVGVLFFSFVFVGKERYKRDASFQDFYIVNVNFQDIEGINLQSKVRVAGVNIGKIISIELSGAFKSHLKLAISSDVKLPIDSAIMVESDGIFGEKYLEVLPGAEDYNIQNNGYITYAQDAMRITSVLERVVEYVKQKMQSCRNCMQKQEEKNI